MHAITHQQGTMQWAEVADLASPGANEVTLRVAWAGVNRADIAQLAGKYPPPPGVSETLGLEVSGTVTQVGTNVQNVEVGQQVCALLAGGGYAEQVVVDARQLLPVPDGLSLRDAAALPEVFATAWLNLYMEAAMQRGERALIHAGASGVGSAAIQLCRAFGNPCFVTVGSQQKRDACEALGADASWNRHDGDFIDAVKDWGGADVILDPVGASYLSANQRVLNPDGRLVVIAMLGGNRAELDYGRLLMKRQRLIGSTLRARPPEQKGHILTQLQEKVWPKLAQGEIKPLIHNSWPITQAAEAHDYLKTDANIGKLLLAVSGEE
ncbi:NAD(P)H-quinone oxidoreductase [Halomonas halocynthiae]|uniref:NAD(P)H-quinone oxidoreductase n=1 Tax=Halomonas halocynthiae TaxID=176290 RepID=UPI0003FFCE53|nr:NAD(P)H-quinone oxidoreductase [Halomonas halocynthiae]